MSPGTLMSSFHLISLEKQLREWYCWRMLDKSLTQKENILHAIPFHLVHVLTPLWYKPFPGLPIYKDAWVRVSVVAFLRLRTTSVIKKTDSSSNDFFSSFLFLLDLNIFLLSSSTATSLCCCCSRSFHHFSQPRPSGCLLPSLLQCHLQEIHC